MQQGKQCKGQGKGDAKTGEEKPNRTYSGEKYFNGYSDHLSIYITLD
jgi:hypothetical protein